jgi:hypothetical protein
MKHRHFDHLLPGWRGLVAAASFGFGVAATSATWCFVSTQDFPPPQFMAIDSTPRAIWVVAVAELPGRRSLLGSKIEGTAASPTLLRSAIEDSDFGPSARVSIASSTLSRRTRQASLLATSKQPDASMYKQETYGWPIELVYAMQVFTGSTNSGKYVRKSEVDIMMPVSTPRSKYHFINTGNMLAISGLASLSFYSAMVLAASIRYYVRIAACSCPRCGYSLVSLDGAPCPECGYAALTK